MTNLISNVNEKRFSNRHARMLTTGRTIVIDKLAVRYSQLADIVSVAIRDDIKYTTITENLFSMHIDTACNFYWLGVAGGYNDGIDTILHCEEFNEGYAVTLFGICSESRFSPLELFDAVLDQVGILYSSDIMVPHMLDCWKLLIKNQRKIAIFQANKPSAEISITSVEQLDEYLGEYYRSDPIFWEYRLKMVK